MIAHVIWVVTGVTVMAFYAVYKLHGETIRQHLREDAIVASEIVEDMLIMMMKRNDADAISSMLPELSRLHHLERIRILDLEGRIVFSSHREEEGSTVKSRRYAEFVSSEQDFETQPVTDDDKQGFIRLRKLKNDLPCQNCHDPSQPVNGVSWLRTSDVISFASLKNDVTGIVVIALGVIVLLSVATEAVLVRSVDRPIREIRRTMEALQNGDFSARVSNTRNDDMGQLAEGLNAMAQKLQLARKHLLEHHRHQLYEAESLAKIGELAAAMAHEIKNPISGIVFALNSLLRETSPKDNHHEIFQEILNQANRVERNLESLLTLAKHHRLERFPTDLNQIIERILLFVRQQPETARIETESRLQKNLPEVLVDPKQIEQVILNLVINAIQAMPQKGKLTISTRWESRNERVIMKVQDTGVGIPPELRDKVFQPFFTTKVHGVGLGLSLCEEIILRHGGKIWFESEVGRGTTFMVALPRGKLESFLVSSA